MDKSVHGQPETGSYGLRREVLSPLETLAQSVSTIAPTTTPVATIPLVCALAGNATWLAYGLATIAILLVAICVGRFARYSSPPGSLATYGFIVTYALVCLALPKYLDNHGAEHRGARIIPWAACLAMLLALIGNLYPVPEGPYGKLPYIYLAYLAVGLLWFYVAERNSKSRAAEG